MSKLTDRVSYLKGMAAGMKLNMEKDSNVLLMEILDAMGEIADEIQSMAEAHTELSDYVESIDDDLSDLEETLFGDDDDELFEGDFEEDEDDEEADDAEFDSDEVIVYACPHCGHELEFTASSVDFDEDYPCPKCNKPVFPELMEDEEHDPENPGED